MIPLDKPYFLYKDAVKRMLTDCIDTSWVGYQGEYGDRLSFRLQRHFDRKYAIPVSSGTHALFMAVAALDLPKGSEVIVPTHCYNGDVVAITLNGLIPKFIDSVQDSPNTSVEIIVDAITDNTKAVLVPHMYGKVIDLTDLKKYNIKIIEDSALTLQPSPNSVGDIVCTSFHNKIITSGEGGAVLCDSEELYHKLKTLWVPSQTNEDGILFLSGRLSNVSAGLALSQMMTLGGLLMRRDEVRKRYDKNLGITSDYDVCWRYQVWVDDPTFAVQYLKECGIQSRQVFRPMHLSMTDEVYPHAEEWYSHHIDLPSGPALELDQVDYVCEKFIEMSSL